MGVPILFFKALFLEGSYPFKAYLWGLFTAFFGGQDTFKAVLTGKIGISKREG